MMPKGCEGRKPIFGLKCRDDCPQKYNSYSCLRLRKEYPVELYW